MIRIAKKLVSILLTLCMALAALPMVVSAVEKPADTAYWVNLTREQTVDMIDRISKKTEERYVVLLCYPSDGSAFVSTAIQQFSKQANEQTTKLYAYACDSSDSSWIDEELKKVFDTPSEDWPNWPLAITYNPSTKKVISREYVGTLTNPTKDPALPNGLLDLMKDNGVASGSSGEDPDPNPEPGPEPNPDPDDPSPDIPEPPAPDLPDGMDQKAWEVLRLVNQHRMGMNDPKVVPLSVFDPLQDTANLRAEEIYQSYRANHTRPDGRICWTAYQECDVLYHLSAENIASGQPTSAIVMDSWLHSPGHRRNIESPKYTHIGVGYYYGTKPDAGPHNWTQDFAACTDCSFTKLKLSASAIYGRQGADLDTLLTEADLAATATCYRHGTCILPVIAAMCEGYDKTKSGDQTITVTYGGQTAELTIATRHTWDAGTDKKSATCTETGERLYTCQDNGCNETRTVTIPATGHDFASSSLKCQHGCDTEIETVANDSLNRNLADPGLDKEEAKAYAENLTAQWLKDLGSTCQPTIEVVEYAAPVDGTPEKPEGEYGHLDYQVKISAATTRMAKAKAASATPSTLRLDIPPKTSSLSASQENVRIITLDAGGGTVNPEAITSGEDGTLSSLPSPTRSGYTFQGWFTEASGGTPITTSTVFDEDTTIYAQWKRKKSSNRPSSSRPTTPSLPVTPTPPTEPVPPTTPSTTVTLDTSAVTMANGSGYSFLVKGNHDTANLRVETSNPNIAVVSLEDANDPRGAKYLVTAKSTGMTEILVTYQGQTTRMLVNIQQSKGSMTLDTSHYFLAPGNQYTIGFSLQDADGQPLSAEQIQTMMAQGKLTVRDSRTGSVAALEQLPSGNFLVTGKQEGTTYIIYEIGGIHASVRIDVKNGVQPHGTSVRKTAHFFK